MDYIESEYLELKEIINADFKKEVIAFANANGGEIYVGVRKNGDVIGVDNPEAEMERISSMIRDGIKPDLTSYTAIERVVDADAILIKVTVSRGERRPYHLTDKGLKPSGVYIRHGVTSAPASDDAIRQMLKESDGTRFDKARAVNQELTFEYATAYFQKCGISFNDNNKRTLQLVTADGYYTNAAMLLSDQCEHSIKCAIYEGTGKTRFQTRKEFDGSILKQMEDAYEFISLSNNLRSDFEGLSRIDKKDYPDYAIRESLLNAVVHRDYDFSGSILINIYDDRMEFISLGGLVKGITLMDIMNGISQSRNSILASVFYRLKLIESYGTGIQRIMESYEENQVKPTIVPAPSSFVITLPNRNVTASEEKEIPLDDEGKVMALFKRSSLITRKQIQEVLNVSSFTATGVINRLITAGRIERVGAGRSTKYMEKK